MSSPGNSGSTIAFFGPWAKAVMQRHATKAKAITTHLNPILIIPPHTKATAEILKLTPLFQKRPISPRFFLWKEHETRERALYL
jgi:hypothetical protein